ncbi:MAG: hypothetical protein UZ22_OP11002000544 [Microgenomates bacterium OLB23]|nr:MAG: hypothetical protein UZ22_OP11002000544 [Microgenomates bacterium OLB23]
MVICENIHAVLNSPVQSPMTLNYFKSTLFIINSWVILRIPEEASAQLPSRGITMVSGTLNGIPFKTLLEPDGRYGPGKVSSHWFRPSKELLIAASARAGDTVQVTLQPTKDWVEPEIPFDLATALDSSPKAKSVWQDITPMARWDWVRWIRAVKTADTRKKHILVALDKLNRGNRRPCCFNRNLCSEPHVSRNWTLLD